VDVASSAVSPADEAFEMLSMEILSFDFDIISKDRFVTLRALQSIWRHHNHSAKKTKELCDGDYRVVDVQGMGKNKGEVLCRLQKQFRGKNLLNSKTYPEQVEVLVTRKKKARETERYKI
tara:strand:+ start:2850 stop:3209 length:360 start_codon:yes stop_codon:yes gene_type:complete